MTDHDLATRQPQPTRPDPNDQTYVLYDGECPFCSAYVRFMKLKQSVGPVRLLDARDGGNEVEDVVKRGFDLNEGMIFHYSGVYYHGADALTMLALLSGNSSVFNRVNATLFRSPRVAQIAYPFLRAGRNTVLKLLGKKQLDR
ncbi:DCC1-like thiol-disulfide oxidoreductase family protein [Novosphingobium sp. 9U]|uniref:DCC1-like thiol-disulfide oxidoreductase family protein n=1 Tax=Novosphingobium sp. 9U TaxID=2653158 RepID=UPI0012F3E4AC|nr:DCC1-like thiol-disulfide oxidoreductase family protein [Novosphingobium sp. 9U]VWX50477.1 conserved hypothetical protein [Novosphingobium sp. 9U]